MKHYKVIFGTHREDGVVYKAGEVVSTHTPLHTMFPGRFEVVGAGTAPERQAPAQKPAQANVGPQAPVVADEDEAPNAPPLANKGRDVTKAFPKAVEEAFQVFKTSDGTYNVYDEDVKCNAKPLVKTDVNPCILAALAGK